MTSTERYQQTTDKISRLLTKLPEESSTRKQLENHLELHQVSSKYLSKKEHRLAFIGNVGTGKTTSICHLLGLLNEQTPVLSTGSGRTTLCEVEIKSGEHLQLTVEPCTDAEVISYLDDFSLYLKGNEADSAEERFKLSAEVERALRNMLDLKISRTKGENGKRIAVDSAKLFANDFSTSDKLRTALIERINLAERTKTIFTAPNETEQNSWVHEIFKTINCATDLNVGLAKKITLEIPLSKLSNDEFSVSIVDTKGVDLTVNRQDLDDCATNDRVLSVLCSRFNDAPDKTSENILKNNITAGLQHRLAAETVMLVLDRTGEAEDVIEVDEAIGDKDEGREIRAEHVANDLAQKFKIESLDILFFDAKTDSNDKLLDSLINKIKLLRQNHEQHIADIEAAVAEIEIELNSQSAKQAKQQVLQTLEPWLKKSENCTPTLAEFFVPLISTISGKSTYAASLRASVNRCGDWHNLDYYQTLAVAARAQCVQQLRPLQDELLVLINNMLSQNELQPAYSLLKQLKNTTEKRLDDLYQMTLARGRSTYESKLKADSAFWNDLYAQWGIGRGYKKRVAHQSEQWFLNCDYVPLEKRASKEMLEAWLRFVQEINSLIGSAVTKLKLSQQH